MGVVAVKEEIYDSVLDGSKAPEGTPELFHGYTYSGIPVAVAAALAVQDIFEKEDIFSKAKKISPYFQDGLHSLKDLKEVVSIRLLIRTIDFYLYSIISTYRRIGSKVTTRINNP